MDLQSELDRRYANTRAAMAAHDLDALIVSGSEYSGFEGGVTYLSGFQIVHRYAYVVLPADGAPSIVFPTEARYVGEHGTTPLEQVFADRPGAEIAARAKAAGWKRVGVFGLDYIMNVRDHSALAGLDLVHFDMEFDHSRAVKSKAELESVRDSVRINQRGFEIFFDAYAPGRSADLSPPAWGSRPGLRVARQGACGRGPVRDDAPGGRVGCGSDHDRVGRRRHRDDRTRTRRGHDPDARRR